MAAQVAPVSPRGSASLLAAIGLAVSQPAAAIGLGDIEVHSFLGEPLEATVAVIASPGEVISAECFSTRQAGADGLPAVSQARFSIDPNTATPRLRVTTFAPQNEPALQLRLNASCPGSGGIVRDYTLLLDPRPVVQPPVVAAPAVAAPSAAPASAPSSTAVPGLHAMSGDTLASIATAIYPRNRNARQAYVEALRAQNPGVAALGADEAIAPGTVLVLPDLREFSRTLRPSSRATAPQEPRPAKPRAERAAPPPRTQAPPPAPLIDVPAPRTPDAQPPRKVEASPPRKTETPPPKKADTPAPKMETPAPKAEPPAPKAESPSTRQAIDAQRPPAKPEARTDGTGRPVLRLSSPELDLSRSGTMDDRARAQMRERLLLLESDDQIAALLAMRNSLRQLEGRVAELQQQVAGMPSAPGAGAGQGQGSGAAPGSGSGPGVAGGAASPGAAALPASAKPTPASGDSLPAWLWGVLALGAAVIVALAWKAFSRQSAGAGPGASASTSPMRGQSSAPGGQSAKDRAPGALDADLQSRRRHFIEERFPELAAEGVSIDDPDAVVKAARLFYEEGSLPRAVELLQFAVEESPSHLQPWLALFEIYRLESFSHEYGQLATRFRVVHGEGDSWQKIQYNGRELDPDNPLYRA